MENRLKEIIAKYINMSVDSINDTTSIKIPGSILIHRMYSEIQDLFETNLQVTDFMRLSTFYDLKKKLGLNGKVDNEDLFEISSLKNENKLQKENIKFESPVSIGIDIEDVTNFPLSEDYWEDRFYTDVFSKKEIAYCLMQPNPSTSFAGKYSAKEAIIKADFSYGNKKLNEIEILNNDIGKPVFRDFAISISHTNSNACAVAVKSQVRNVKKDIFSLASTNSDNTSVERKNNKLLIVLAVIQIIFLSIFLIEFFP